MSIRTLFLTGLFFIPSLASADVGARLGSHYTSLGAYSVAAAPKSPQTAVLTAKVQAMLADADIGLTQGSFWAWDDKREGKQPGSIGASVRRYSDDRAAKYLATDYRSTPFKADVVRPAQQAKVFDTVRAAKASAAENMWQDYLVDNPAVSFGKWSDGFEDAGVLHLAVSESQVNEIEDRRSRFQ